MDRADLAIYEKTRRLVRVTRIDALAPTAAASRLSDEGDNRAAKWHRREKDDVAVLNMVEGVLWALRDKGLTTEVAELCGQALHNVRHREAEIRQVVDTPGFSWRDLQTLKEQVQLDNCYAANGAEAATEAERRAACVKRRKKAMEKFLKKARKSLGVDGASSSSDDSGDESDTTSASGKKPSLRRR